MYYSSSGVLLHIVIGSLFFWIFLKNSLCLSLLSSLGIFLKVALLARSEGTKFSPAKTACLSRPVIRRHGGRRWAVAGLNLLGLAINPRMVVFITLEPSLR